MADDVFAAIDVGEQHDPPARRPLQRSWSGSPRRPQRTARARARPGATWRHRRGEAARHCAGRFGRTWRWRKREGRATSRSWLRRRCARPRTGRSSWPSSRPAGRPVVVLNPAREAYLAVVATALTRTWPLALSRRRRRRGQHPARRRSQRRLAGLRSEPVGSARLGIRLRHDPPTWREVAAMQARVSQALSQRCARCWPASPCSAASSPSAARRRGRRA